MNTQLRYPASRNQQAIWLFSRLFPANAAYNLLWQVRITGPLEISRLLRALETVLDRHEALRTSFSFENDALSQVITPHLPVDCELQILTGDCAQRELQLDSVATALGLAPFNLTNGPLIRFRLI